MTPRFISRFYQYESVKSLKNAIRPVKHFFFGKNGIYLVMDEVAKSCGGADRVKTVVDIGAANGEYALHFVRKFPHAHVHCFETNPRQLQSLRWRLKKYLDRIVIHEVALSDRDGEAAFYEVGYKDASSLLPKEGAREFKVKLARLDGFNLPAIDFMKVDCEGVEWEVFKGGEKTLDGVKNLFVEIHPQFKNFNGDDQRTMELLARHGFAFVGKFEDFFFRKSHIGRSTPRMLDCG